MGRAIAVAFALREAKVVVTGRDENRLNKMAEELRGRGMKIFPRRYDVTQRNEVEALKEETKRNLGPVEILINNAGMAPAASFLEMDDRLWHEVLDVNLHGAYYCCKLFLPDMLAAGWGRIVNIASTVAKIAYPRISAYTTSKHALLGLTRSLALETARGGVTVNAICPGYLDTDLTRENAARMAETSGKTVDEVLRLFAATSPQKRLITPEEVAFLALTLASESAKGITGQAIHIDGGTVMA